eukprot:4494579-Pleurochrysis_carterae.AAC.1
MLLQSVKHAQGQGGATCVKARADRDGHLRLDHPACESEKDSSQDQPPHSLESAACCRSRRSSVVAHRRCRPRFEPGRRPRLRRLLLRISCESVRDARLGAGGCALSEDKPSSFERLLKRVDSASSEKPPATAKIEPGPGRGVAVAAAAAEEAVEASWEAE